MSEQPVLDERIQRIGKLSTEAFSELIALQKGTKRLLKTGTEMIDCHIGGLLPSDCVIIAGAPSTGKSQTLYEMTDNMLQEEINPEAKDFVSLEYSMEMKMLNKILRATNNLLDKKKTEILFNEFSPEEQLKVTAYHKALYDSRRFVCQSPVAPKEFYKMTRDFCLIHKDKKAILISADHLLLFSGSEKQSVLEQVIEYVNLLKLEFENVYFFLLSQLNRSAISIIKEKDNSMMPNNSMLFGSSFMEQIASYIVIINNPFKIGILQYLRVNKERYEYLESFFGEEDTKGRVSFNTMGNLFYTITKTRESDYPFRDLFIKPMRLNEEQKNKMKQSVLTKDSFTLPNIDFNVPKYDTTTTQIPNLSLNEAFGINTNKEEDSNSPF